MMDNARLALVAEDEVFVVLDVEDSLRSMDIEIGGTFASNAAAIAWLNGNSPRVAVIDYRLRDGTSEPLARVLVERDIPFVVYSGNSFEQAVHGEVFSRQQWIDKPSDALVLEAAIRQAIDRP